MKILIFTVIQPLKNYYMQQFIKPNRKVNYGLDLTKVFVGQEIVSNYNITVDESVLSLWSGFMPTSSYPENSREFAGRLGFHQIFLPYGFLMNLTISLGAESYGNSSIHIHELRNALYLSPAFPGDTFSCSIRIRRISEQGRHNFVVADHILFNQKGEAVFLLECEMVFPHFVPRVTIASTLDAKSDEQPVQGEDFGSGQGYSHTKQG